MFTERYPNLYLIGAAKSGTSSLVEYFRTKRDFYVSPVKEPFYFVEGYAISNKDEYLNLYENWKDEKYAVDASTGYLFSEESLVKIRDQVENAKIVILLRNPIDMSYSFWKFMVANGSEQSDFFHAISEEQVAYRKSDEFEKKCINWSKNYLYIERAKYSSQIDKVIEVFSKENVHIELFENVNSDFDAYIGSLSNFLGLKLSNGNGEILPKVNEAKMPSWIVHFIKKSKFLSPVRLLFRKTLNIKVRHKIRHAIYFSNFLRNKKDDRVLTHMERNILKDVFMDDVICLKRSLPELNFEKWKDFDAG